jgi:hypothetical protein
MGLRGRSDADSGVGAPQIVVTVMLWSRSSGLMNLGDGARSRSRGAIGSGKPVVEDDLAVHVDGLVVDEGASNGSAVMFRPMYTSSPSTPPAGVDREGMVDGFELRGLRESAVTEALIGWLV